MICGGKSSRTPRLRIVGAMPALLPLLSPTPTWSQEAEMCRYGEWSEAVAIGGGDRIVRFGSMAEFRNRELVFVGSDLRNFEEDTIQSTPFSLLSTAGRSFAPPTGGWHWQSASEPMSDGRLAVVWGESETASRVALMDLPRVHSQLRMAVLSEAGGWSDPLTLLESAEPTISGRYGWALAADAHGSVHAAVNARLALVHIASDGDEVRQTRVADGLFAPAIAVRGDTILVAAIGPTTPEDRQPILLGRSMDAGANWETWWLGAETTGLLHSLTLRWESAQPVIAWTEGLTSAGRLDVVRVLRLLPDRDFEEQPRFRLPSSVMRVQFREDKCGSVHVLYTHLVGGLNAENGRIEYRRLGRGQWTPPERLSSQGSALEVFVREFEDRLVAAWTTITDGDRMVTEYVERKIDRSPQRPQP